jgi:hypothetical protein
MHDRPQRRHVRRFSDPGQCTTCVGPGTQVTRGGQVEDPRPRRLASLDPCGQGKPRENPSIRLARQSRLQVVVRRGADQTKEQPRHRNAPGAKGLDQVIRGPLATDPSQGFGRGTAHWPCGVGQERAQRQYRAVEAQEATRLSRRPARRRARRGEAIEERGSCIAFGHA